MVSLIPGESESRLKQLFGNDYVSLSPMEAQTLVTADLEGEVSNSRLQLFRSEHPTELTRMLQGLAGRGFLEQIGQKRGASYRLPTWPDSLVPRPSRSTIEASPLALEASPLAPGASSLAPEASYLAPEASSFAPGAPPPVTPKVLPDTLSASVLLTPPERDAMLIEIARPAREKKKLMPSLTRKILLSLCENRFLSADQMSQLMDRGKDKLQVNFLSDMVEAGELELQFPNQSTHPAQAYRTRKS